MDDDLRHTLPAGLGAPRTSSLKASSIVVTRMHSDDDRAETHTVIAPDDSFCAIVQLADFERHKLWRGGELIFEGGRSKGALEITDLRRHLEYHHLSPFDAVRFDIPFSHLRAFTEDVGRPEFSGFECPPGTTDDVVLGLAQALVPALENPQHASALFLEQINLAIMTHLTQTYGGLHFPSRKKGTLAPWQEKRAVDFLASHTNAAFSIADLAAACDLSRSYFIKAFKETFGRTPYRWLMEFRVGRAKELLREDASIAQIAVSCGFADQSHLTRVFSDIVGEAPGTWRRKNRPQ